jgi:formate dehydrogenase gamma subunit
MNTTPHTNNHTEKKKAHHPGKILRFRKTERMLHWALAVPFLICFSSAMILVLFYNPTPDRPYRAIFSWIHKISGVLLMIMPLFAVMKSKGDFKIHFYNIHQAWIWTLEDLKWLFLMGLAAVNKKYSLPEQGKFNAAEKLNFMYLMATYPLYIVSGLAIWLTDLPFLPWLLHCYMAVFAMPLVFGHIYMATINKNSRVGLHGMISGHVDRKWAKHHYGRWYKEHFESE